MVLFNTCLLFSQTVSNVAFTQRTDGSLKVDISYDLVSSEAAAITVEASNNGGTDWNLVCTSLTGAVGEGVTAGTDKSIEWDFYTDNPGQSGDNYVVKVTAEVPTTGTLTIGSNTYNTVKIGNQWWMAENLRETHYRNGEPIPEETNNSTWASLTTGARCAYHNSASTANTYGYLYNWYAVNNHNVNPGQYLAPSGWHVPTDDDWTTLTTYLGNNAGGKLKETGITHWPSPNAGATNESGFSALPGGYRSNIDGGFYNLGADAGFWSATQSSSTSAWYRFLSSEGSDVYRYNTIKRHGFSVRLVRDN